MKKLTIFALVLFVFGCGGYNQSEKFSATTNKPIKITRMEKVDVPYSEPSEEQEGELKEELWTKAEKQGMRKINKSWLGRRLLVPISNATVFGSDYKKFVSREGEITFPDSEDVMLSREFEVSASFTPVDQLGGRIVKIEKGRTIAGEDSQVSIKFHGVKPAREEAYFLVARPESIEKKNYVRVIGSGKVFNTMQDLSQGILHETTQEIMVDDRVYLLQTKIRPIQEEEDKEKVNATEIDQEERIIVEPVPEPETTTPKGTK